MTHIQKKHAVVIGGSIAGMLTARVLADYYEQVTVLDRDTFPDSPDHRKGVPQSQHAHGLLARGQITIERFFPGILGEIREAGAQTDGNLLIISPAGKLPNPVFSDAKPKKSGDDGPKGVYASRFFLEWHIRRRLNMLDNVKIQNGVEVVNILATADQTRITGVEIEERHTDADRDSIAADLVVDASGRRSKVSTWLADLGYDTPPEEHINSGLGYASRFYRKPENFPSDWAGIIINGRPPDNPRAGLIMPIEEDMWHVSIGGFAGHHPPNDEAGFMQWARDLPDPSLYEAIRIAEPLTPIRGYRTDVNTLRHFEKLKRWPKNFVVTGDAVCCFNPIHGQGMSTSAMDALALRRVLKEWTADPTLDFERLVRDRIAETVAAPWLIATGEDLRWSGVKLEGSSHWGMSLFHRYMNIYLRQATQDQQLASLYHAVINLLVPPAMLRHPAIVARVLGKTMMSKFQRKSGDELALTSQALAQLRSRPAFNES